ncbi:pre-mRNA-processing factor 17 [Globomyces sp. JEL0801]|nr:pre-mRNA-processing factor 17 [Globomyces sp. JEL0801]
MNLLDGYGDSESDEEIQKSSKRIKTFNSAPAVQDQKQLPTIYTKKSSKEITFNVPLEDLSKPLQGPINPYAVSKQVQHRNTMAGFVQEHEMSDITFNSLQRTYESFGYTVDPNGVSANSLVGDLESAKNHNEENGIQKEIHQMNHSKVLRNACRTNRKGPWAGFEGDVLDMPARTAEQDNYVPDPENQFDKTKLNDEHKSIEETSIFHGKQQLDYLGRSFLHPPNDVGIELRGEVGHRENFIPKNLIHTWTGHTKAVNVIQFFPKSAHLIISGSMDHKIKIWDVYNERNCKRTYMGHSKGIKDLNFNNSGTHFLSASYDKWIKHWDTETGQCIGRFTTKKIPYCVTFNPHPDKQHVFLTGCQDKKVYQFDIRSGEVVQQYDQHNGAVNTITFIDDDRRFITTSDDKSVRCWEVDIPVVIKYINDPDMHSMPAVSKSWDGKS